MSLSFHQEFGTTAPQLCQFEKDHSGGHLETSSLFLAVSPRQWLVAGGAAVGIAAVLGSRGEWYSSTPGSADR